VVKSRGMGAWLSLEGWVAKLDSDGRLRSRGMGS
jgi:hypothetical protein